MPHQVLWLIPEFDKVTIVIALALCGLLGFFFYSKKVLDTKASILAAVMGFLLIIYSDIFWFFVLLFFLIISYMVTVWKYNFKRERGLSEGNGGERGIKNVVANGAIPMMIAIFNQPLDAISDGLSGFMFIAAIAIATSDTFASEIGIMANEPRLITSPGTKVRPGIDGGVSLLGNSAALFGSVIIAVVGMIFISNLIIDSGPHGLEMSWIPAVILVAIGWLGCQLDSLLGATLQKKGLLTNNTVNFSTILIGVLIAVPFYLVISSLL